MNTWHGKGGRALPGRTCRWLYGFGVIVASCLVLGKVSSCGFDTDADGDGFFGAEEEMGKYAYDCNDNDPVVRQGKKFYLDADGDGLGDAAHTCFVCLAPADEEELYSGYSVKGVDFGCESESEYVYNDQDCDDEDEEVGMGKRFYADADEDGLGDPNLELSVYLCPADAIPESPEGYVQNSLDCDDTQTWMGGPEGILTEYYLDFDGDGYGDPGYYVMVCSSEPPEGSADYSFTSDNTDCDDKRGEVNPAALFDCPEEGTAIDNNCNGIYDEDEDTIFYPDDDGDGFGRTLDGIDECPPPANFVRNPGDCDDEDKNTYPGEGCVEPTPTPESKGVSAGEGP